MDLLGEDDGAEGLRINAKFAEKFEREARYKELQRGAALGILDDDEEDSSEAEEEDDDAAALSERLDAQIIHTINAIRKRDPKIYDKERVWFERNEDSEDDQEEEDADAEDKGSTPSKKRRFKDVMREQLLQEAEHDDDDDDRRGSKQSHSKINTQLEYDAEQSDIRARVLKSINFTEGDGSEDAEEDMLKPVVKTSEDKAAEEELLRQELEEMKRLGKCGLDDPAQDDFLFEYISKQKWKDKSLTYESNDALDDSADEEEIDETDRFESTYNFRFEEVSSDLAGQVVGHARQVDESVRRKDTKRKEQREKRLERKEKERKAKEAELRRLKNLKRLEVLRLYFYQLVFIPS